MTSLADLPADLLAAILGVNELPTDFLKLWVCGHKNLCSRLALGLSRIELFGHRLLKAKFPRLLLQLRSLRFLRLDSSNTAQLGPDSLLSLLLSLSPTLESLHLYAMDGKTLQENLVQWSSRDLNFGLLYPRLHTLELGSGHLVSAGTIAFLPPTLTHLVASIRLSYSPQEEDRTVMTRLPRSLVRIRSISARYGSGCHRSEAGAFMREDWANAPPHLEEIDELDIAFYITQYDWIPRKLQHGKLRNGMTPLSPQSMLQLPPLLQTLAVTVTSSTEEQLSSPHWRPNFPTSLTSLRTTNNFFASPGRLLSLPRFLTKIEFGHIHVPLDALRSYQGADSGAHNSIWPPLLTSMTWSASALTGSDIILLPRTLKEVEIGLHAQHGARTQILIDASHLPPLLTSLTLTCHNEGFVTFENDLPPLTYLSIAGDVWDDKPKNTLPSTLTSLKLLRSFHADDYYDYYLSLSHVCWLSATLTQLVIPEWKYKWFSFLPRNLTSFSAQALLDLCPASKEDLETNFAYLPATLTDLTLAGQSSRNDPLGLSSPLRLFSHLSQLVSLRLAIDNVSSYRLRDFPKSLTTLYFHLTKIDEEDAPFIPPRLTSFVGVQRKHMEPYEVAHWPFAILSEVNGDSSHKTKNIALAEQRVAEASKCWQSPL